MTEQEKKDFINKTCAEMVRIEMHVRTLRRIINDFSCTETEQKPCLNNISETEL